MAVNLFTNTKEHARKIGNRGYLIRSRVSLNSGDFIASFDDHFQETGQQLLISKPCANREAAVKNILRKLGASW